MKTIRADFNNSTEHDTVRLGTFGAEADMARWGLGPGDRVLLADEDFTVEAVLADDPYYGRVGVPDWATKRWVDAPETLHPMEADHGLPADARPLSPEEVEGTMRTFRAAWAAWAAEATRRATPAAEPLHPMEADPALAHLPWTVLVEGDVRLMTRYDTDGRVVVDLDLTPGRWPAFDRTWKV